MFVLATVFFVLFPLTIVSWLLFVWVSNLSVDIVYFHKIILNFLLYSYFEQYVYLQSIVEYVSNLSSLLSNELIPDVNHINLSQVHLNIGQCLVRLSNKTIKILFTWFLFENVRTFNVCH